MKRERHSTASASVLLAALLSIVTPQLAQAAEPLESWVVGPIDALSSSGLPYCSMKNVFAGGITLVFARDTAGGNSIAVDFGKPMLPPGKKYHALVEAGFESRTVAAIAATDAVLLVQMGQDMEFYDTLASKDVMQLGFDSHSLSFGLKGSADGLTELDECTRTLTSGIASPEKPLKPDEEKIPEDKITLGQMALESTLKEEVERLEAEKRRLLLENQIISSRAIEQEKTELEKLRRENERLKRALENKAVKPSRKPSAPPEEKKPASSPVSAAVEPVRLLPSLLRRAGVVGQETDGAFTWESAGVFGAATERPLSAGEDLQAAVDAYANDARVRCAGDFAHNAGGVVDMGGVRAVKAEMACIDGKDDAAAAVLYVTGENRFAVLTQEGAADKMPHALHLRDVMADSLKK
jgi:hypothetical protein